MSVMQGFERMDRQLTDVAALAGHLVPAGSMFAFLAAYRAEVFPGADYADLFAPPGFGRPSVPATQMAAVMTLQALHDYSDRETAEAVRFGVRWKAAIGAALDDPGFDPRALVYWRRRIAKSARPHRVNEAVKMVVEQTGILRGRRRRAVDSTIIDDAVATQDTITPGRSAIFGAACLSCPLRARCTTARSGRILNLHPLARLLRAARATWAAEAGLREDYARHRPNVERVIAQVATSRGRRIKLRYRGVTGNHAWLKRRTAALNLRNLASRGLTRRDSAWMLAT
jgi:hypothetical protein